jgi:cardiolipin synthase
MDGSALLILVVVLAFFAAQIATLFRILLRERRAPAARLAWIICVFALPGVGIVLYFLFGEVDFGRYKLEQLKAIEARLPRTVPGVAPVPPGVLPAGQAFARAAASNGFDPVAGNTAEIAQDSDDAIARLVADIDAAEAHVHLLFYIWLEDANGTRVLEAVRRAAARGVTCRVMVDALGSRKLAQSRAWAELSEAGVQTGLAFGFRVALLHMFFARVDIRNHRKIAVIDGRIAYVGSQNCADAAFLPKAKYAPWVDVMARMEGPVAWQMQRLFAEDWELHTGEDLSAMLDRAAGEMPDGKVTAVAMGTGPDDGFEAVPDTAAALFAGARERLIVTTPYYVPNEMVQQAICAAALRGVHVTMILPQRNDSFVVGLASRSYFQQLLRAGVEIFEYPDGLLHSKIITMDGKVALIGSANLDRRSFELNFENSLLAADPGFVGALDARQRAYIGRSHAVTRAEVDGWSTGRRALQNLMATMAPLL